MRNLFILAIFALCLSNVFSLPFSKRESRIRQYEAVTPMEESSRRGRTIMNFPESTSFNFQAFGQNFNLKLKQKQHFLPEDYMHEVQRFNEKGELIQRFKNNSLPGNCFYEGTVNDDPKTLIAVSTCKGLNGLILHPDGKEYFIEPFDDNKKRVDGSHAIYRMDDVDQEHMSNFCGLDQSSSSNTKRVFGQNIQEASASSNSKRATRTVELLIVNDNTRFGQVGPETEQDAANIVNIVDGIYSSTNFVAGTTYRVSLSAQLTWQFGDPITPSTATNPAEVNVQGTTGYLSLFNNWVSNNPVGTSYAALYDNHQLLSGYDFAGATLGLAGVGTMCSGAQSGGVEQTYNQANNAHSATVLAHEMGHNFNMLHDGDANGAPSCPASVNIMSASVCGSCPALNTFSSCSISALTSYCGGSSCNCLTNTPSVFWGNPVCGNGFIEAGEQCDCGSRIPDSNGQLPTSCASRDPCCNMTTCQLLPGRACSSLQPCCTPTCTVITDQTHVCRPPRSECDIAETCPGSSPSCRNDTFYSSQRTCGANSGGACFQGFCVDVDKECTDKGYVGVCEYALSQNSGNPCGSIICAADATGLTCANLNTPIPDGAPCGRSRICYQGNCVNSGVVNGLPCIPATCDDYPNLCGEILSGCDSTTKISCSCSNGSPCNQGSCSVASLRGIGGCFIATAAYGSFSHESVWALRSFRDNYLKGTYFGEMFIQAYYHYSPAIAATIAQSEFARSVTRAFLQPIVFIVQTIFL